MATIDEEVLFKHEVEICGRKFERMMFHVDVEHICLYNWENRLPDYVETMGVFHAVLEHCWPVKRRVPVSLMLKGEDAEVPAQYRLIKLVHCALFDVYARKTAQRTFDAYLRAAPEFNAETNYDAASAIMLWLSRNAPPLSRR